LGTSEAQLFHGLGPTRSLGEVEHVAWNSAAMSWAALFERRRPLIIRDYLNTWPAFERWSLEYLAERLGTCQVSATVLGDQAITNLDYADTGKRQREMAFSELAERIKAQANRPAQSGDVYLAQGGSILGRPRPTSRYEGVLSAVLGDLSVPEVGLPLANINIWLGSGGNTSYLHFDPLFNMLAVLKGRKHFALISPRQTSHVYPLYYRDPLGSAVNLKQPDYSRHPRLRDAEYSIATLEAGEAIYVPPGWWHFVTSEGVNIAVSMWWKPRVRPEWLLNPPMRWLWWRALEAQLSDYVPRIVRKSLAGRLRRNSERRGARS
jgi:hypothetical protein